MEMIRLRHCGLDYICRAELLCGCGVSREGAHAAAGSLNGAARAAAPMWGRGPARDTRPGGGEQEPRKHQTTPRQRGARVPGAGDLAPFLPALRGRGGRSARRAQTGSSRARVHGGPGRGQILAAWPVARLCRVHSGCFGAAASANAQPWGRSGDVSPSSEGCLCHPPSSAGPCCGGVLPAPPTAKR